MKVFHHEYPNDQGGGALPPAPGIGEATPGSPVSSSAATQTTVPQDPAPGPVPYSRFKEVNDAKKSLEEQYQPFAEFEDFGYGADDLQRLVSWEQEYTQDPAGTWLRQAEQIESLPPEVKAAIAASQVGGTQGTPTTDGTPPQSDDGLQESDDEPPVWAQPLLQRHAEETAAKEAEAISGFYDAIVKAWDDLDTAQGIRTPDAAKHAFIASASVNSSSAEDLLRNSREAYLSSREEILGSAVKVPGRDGNTVPRSVPGGGPGSGGATPPPRPRTLKEASRMAQADAEAGLLGPLSSRG
jgi:hypothetical protein